MLLNRFKFSGWGLAAACFLALPFGARAQTSTANMTVNAAVTVTSFIPIDVFGNNTAYWAGQTNNYAVTAAVQQAGNYFLRYPGGSSSDTYHWNGTGSFDGGGHWVPNNTTWSYGFDGKMTYTGTTGSNGSTDFPYSLITDGSTSTQWLSNSDTQFPNHQWAYIDLTGGSSTVNVSAVSIIWGTPYASSYEVQYWTGASNAAPYQASSEAGWTDFSGGNITGGTGGTSHVTFTTAESTRYVRVLLTSSSAGAGGAYSIEEFYAYNGASVIGANQTSTSQPKVVVSSTDPACSKNYTTSPPGSMDFGSFMTYAHSMNPNAIPLITVNVGTGTPQEAAAWVNYANNVKGYGIKYWQIGNEMDGIWECGGPLRADDYAHRFTEYYNAMKAADPTIVITGPVAGGPYDNSAAYDGENYVQSFLSNLNKLGAISDLGAVDFHWYPGSTTASAELQTPSQVSTYYTNLSGWLSTAGADANLPVIMSEYNISAGTPVLMNQLSTGLWLANWLGEYIHYFGSRGFTNLWDTLNGSSDTTNNTQGDQGYLQVESGTYQYQKRANYWAMQMMAADWATAGDSQSHQLILTSSSQPLLVAYADARPDGVYSVVVINKDPTNAYNTAFTIGPFTPDTTATEYVFNSSSYAWETTSSPYHASPDSAPTTFSISGISNAFQITFVPYSITVLHFTNSNQPTNTPTLSPTATYTRTPTPTSTSTNTRTATPTLTITNSPTLTTTSTWTGTPTHSPTVTSTGTPTVTATVTETPTDTLSPTETFTPTETDTFTDSPTDTWTGTPTYTLTITDTPTETLSPTVTDSMTDTPSLTVTSTPTETGTFTETSTPTSSFTPTFTPTPTDSPTLTLTPVATATPSAAYLPFPNPDQGGEPVSFYYNVPAGAQAVKFKIFTTAFRKIYEDDSLPLAQGQYLYSLDWSKIGLQPANGLYYFVLSVEGGSQSGQKVMKALLLH